MIFFCLERLCVFLVPRDCVIFPPKKLHDFCPEILRDFFCLKRLHDFFSRLKRLFDFCPKGLSGFFVVPKGCVILFCPERLRVTLKFWA